MSVEAGNEVNEPRLGAALALPGLVVVLLLLLLAAKDAGFQATVWYPAGLLLVGLLVVVLASGTAARPAVPTSAAIAALAAFTLWSFASIAWSDVSGHAWDGANRTLVYLVAFALVTVMPLPRGWPVALLGLYVTGVACLAVATLVRAAVADDPASFFIDGRLAEPAGYPNATAMLFLASAWPAFALATTRALAPALRGILLAEATVLVGTAMLAQSRASVIAVAGVALLHLVVVPGAARSLVAFAITGSVLAAAAPTLLDVYPGARGERLAAPLHDAVVALLAAALVAGAVGWVLAATDRRVEAKPRTAARVRRSVVLLACVCVIVTAASVVYAAGDPVGRVADAWEQFSGGQAEPTDDSHLASGLGSNRYDFWRVALGRFADRPLTGIGADNFAADYLLHRRSDEEPLYPHSLEVRIASQTGIPGIVFFALFAAAAVAAGLRAPGRGSVERVALRGGVVAAAYWAVHGSVDWFWEFPGLTLPAMAWLGLAANAATGSRPRPPLMSQGRRPLALAVAVALVAGATLVPPWLAAAEVRTAASGWVTDPERALARLDRARRLNPLTDEADVVAGVIASRRGDRTGMEVAFRRALERNGSSWFSRLELGLAAAEAGRRDEALRWIREALARNPREPILREVLDTIRERRRVDRAEIERRFLERANALTH